MPFDAELGGESATSLISVERADELAELRVGGSAWTDLEDEDKERALATASREITTLEADPGLLGERTDADQALPFPRTGIDDADDEIPALVEEAVFELAFSYIPILLGTSTVDALSPDRNTGNVKRKRTDVLETEYFAPTTAAATGLDRFPAMVQRLLAGFVVEESANAWGSAVVTRGS